MRTSSAQQRGARTLAAIAVIAAASRFSLSFLSSPVVLSESAALDRRSALLGAAASLGALNLQAPAFAAEAPQQVQVNGLPRSHIKGNGLWSIVPDQKINGRAVYKKDGNQFYLMLNDCAEFQFSNELSGSCDGWAKESEKQWKVDGVAAKVSVKPMKPEPVATTATAEASKIFAVSASDLNKKLLGLEGKSDQELLFGAEDVSKYIRANGGQDYLANQFKLDAESEKTASSLEERLAKRSLPGLSQRR